MAELTIDEARSRHEAELLALPNVIGVGLGERDGEPVITVLVTSFVPETELPPTLEGYAVVVEEIGFIEAERSQEDQ